MCLEDLLETLKRSVVVQDIKPFIPLAYQRIKV